MHAGPRDDHRMPYGNRSLLASTKALVGKGRWLWPMVRYCLAYKPLVLITQAGSFAHQVLSFGRSLSGLGERTLNLAPHGENYFGFSLVRHRTRSPTTEADYQRLVVGGNYSARSIGAAEQHSTYGLRLAGLPGRPTAQAFLTGFCAEGEIRTHTPLPAADFKSAAYTVPPLRQGASELTRCPSIACATRALGRAQ